MMLFSETSQRIPPIHIIDSSSEADQVQLERFKTKQNPLVKKKDKNKYFGPAPKTVWYVLAEPEGRGHSKGEVLSIKMPCL